MFRVTIDWFVRRPSLGVKRARCPADVSAVSRCLNSCAPAPQMALEAGGTVCCTIFPRLAACKNVTLCVR